MCGSSRSSSGLFGKSLLRRHALIDVQPDFFCWRLRVGPRWPSAAPPRFFCGSLFQRRLSLFKTGDCHLVEAGVYFLRRDQISHRGFERLVPHPVLYGADVEAGPERPRSVRRSECLQVEFGRIEPRAFCHALQRSSMWYSRFPFGEENTKLQPGRRVCALSRSINWTGIGTSRSSQRLG